MVEQNKTQQPSLASSQHTEVHNLASSIDPFDNPFLADKVKKEEKIVETSVSTSTADVTRSPSLAHSADAVLSPDIAAEIKLEPNPPHISTEHIALEDVKPYNDPYPQDGKEHGTERHGFFIDSEERELSATTADNKTKPKRKYENFKQYLHDRGAETKEFLHERKEDVKEGVEDFTTSVEGVAKDVVDTAKVLGSAIAEEAEEDVHWLYSTIAYWYNELVISIKGASL